VIGAGNYADNRYGACACTGYGEMAIRCSTARSLVLYLKMGLSLDRASREAMSDLRHLTVPFPPRMNLVAVDAKGHHVGLTTEPVRQVRYVYQTGRMMTPSVEPRLVIPLKASRRLGSRDRRTRG
jgi:beta-aspartyl-peptidase (threonine type)